MDEIKPWYTSKVIWASLVGGIVTVLNLFHIDISSQSGPIVDSIVNVIGIVAAITAIVGRVTTTAKIGPASMATRNGGVGGINRPPMRAFIAAALLPLAFTFGGCQTTGDPGADTQSFWNSPAMQAELTAIQNAAFTFLNGWISSHTGAARASTSAKDATFAHLKAKYPTVPNQVLRGAVDEAARR